MVREVRGEHERTVWLVAALWYCLLAVWVPCSAASGCRRCLLPSFELLAALARCGAQPPALLSVAHGVPQCPWMEAIIVHQAAAVTSALLRVLCRRLLPPGVLPPVQGCAGRAAAASHPRVPLLSALLPPGADCPFWGLGSGCCAPC